MVYDFVFVVLVYRNTKDLEDFFSHFNIPKSKIIVVNSFYDETSRKVFEDIAEKNGADFLNVPNKGYGAGNNRGCEYALEHYDFKYLVISNADVEIVSLKVSYLSPTRITAPKIVTLSGKRQNPHQPWLIRSYEKLKYRTFLKRKKRLLRLIVAPARILRELFLFFHRQGKIYCAHGAFVILPNQILKQISPIYNEKMFLFCEEDHLAQLAKSRGITIYYDDRMEVLHHEDGSTSSLNDTFNVIRQSFIEYYTTWFIKP